MLLTGLLLRLLPGGKGGRPRGRPRRHLRVAACCCNLVCLGSGGQLAGLAEAAGGHLSWTDYPCSRRDTQKLADCKHGMGSIRLTSYSDDTALSAWELAASKSGTQEHAGCKG